MFEFLRGRRRRDKAVEKAVEKAAAPVAAPLSPPVADPAAMRPGQAIAYSAELIPRLQADHRQLFETFDHVMQAFHQRDFPAMAASLEKLRSGLQDHLMLENIKLYVYLRQNLAHEPQDHQLVTSFRKEMDGIGREAMAFVEKYKRIAEQPSLADSFESDAERVRQIVADRMSREEATLYQLYQPSY